MTEGPRGPVDATLVPRYAGPATFARLPRLDEVGRADIAVVGVPFYSGVSYRPGARFGPAHIRQSSRLLRPYNPAQDLSPFSVQQVADAGDITANPFDITAAIPAIEAGADTALESADRLVTPGGGHTIALPLLRAPASPSRCCAPPRDATGPLRSCTSTPPSTRGTPTSASRTPTARRSAGPPKR